MHNAPLQPLNDLQSLREENERLRDIINYTASCLSRFAARLNNPEDQKYIANLTWTLEQESSSKKGE